MTYREWLPKPEAGQQKGLSLSNGSSLHGGKELITMLLQRRKVPFIVNGSAIIALVCLGAYIVCGMGPVLAV